MSAPEYKSMIDALLALEPWSIEDAYTHPEDFLVKGRIGIQGCESFGLVEYEFDCNSKWYRLTDTGRRVIEKYKAGISLDAIFKTLRTIEKAAA